MISTRASALSLAGLYCLLVACSNSSGERRGAAGALDTAAGAISAEGLLQHIKDLSADSMEGRAPGTPGEDKAVAYMQSQFKALGLKPGNPDGTYLQNVDLIGYKAHPVGVATRRAARRSRSLTRTTSSPTRATERPRRRSQNSDVVFVGYGVVAPEYGWDDYKGVDVKGKTILMLDQRSAGARSTDDTALDTTMFKGRAMTYYGRWTYKYEIASTKGAAAAIIIHETGPAGYPYAVVSGSNSQEQFDVPSADAEKRVPVEGWLTLDKAKEIISAAGQNFDSLKAAAARKDFKPVALNAKANYDVKIDSRQIQSHNIVAKLEGTDKKDEYVVYTAHWDHLGKDTTLKGDQIYNGAADNASGSSALIEIAKAFTKLPTPPRRSILFLSVTAEEKGLGRQQVLRDAPVVSAHQDRRQHQHGRPQPVGKDERLHRDRARELDARRRAHRRAHSRATAPCAPTPSRRRASTTGPITLSSQSRACLRSTPTRASTSSASRPATACRSATSTRRTTITSHRTRSSRIGTSPAAWPMRGCCSGSAISWRRPTRCRNGNRVPSSRRRAIR